jgi:hypothetical protein
MAINMHRHWYKCDVSHKHNQWIRETPETENSPCTLCGLLHFP